MKANAKPQSMKRLFDLFRPKTIVFITVLKEYFAHKAIGVKDSTTEKHGYFFDNIKRFLNDKDLDNIQIHEIKIKHMEQMRMWLLENRKCSAGHASRHIEHCQSAFDFAVMMEYYTHNAIDSIKCQRDEVETPVSLDTPELKKLLNHHFSTDTYRLVADLFLFQCFTGLSYMDLWLYELTSEGGIEWVTSSRGRGKNNKPYWAEYNSLAAIIHDKYAGKFPYITNQAYNRTIKKIAFSLNVNKVLSSHNARKTYATLRYQQGMSIESIADELGNSPDVTRKHYITLGNERVKHEVERLRGIPLLRFS